MRLFKASPKRLGRLLFLFVLVVMSGVHGRSAYAISYEEYQRAQEEAINHPHSVSQRIFQNVLFKKVKADIKEHFYDRVVKDIKSILVGEPMSPESQAVIIHGIYLTLDRELSSYGIRLSEASFSRNMAHVLKWSSKMGLYPNALTVGSMAHAQHGIGGAFGVEFNFYFDEGDLKVTTYNMGGVGVGPDEELNIQFYGALCFGNCAGGEGSGAFIGVDGGGGIGLGENFFLNICVELEDLLKIPFQTMFESIRELYKAKALYAGFGTSVGVDAGGSANFYYYRSGIDKVIVPKGKLLTPKAVSSLKLL